MTIIKCPENNPIYTWNPSDEIMEESKTCTINTNANVRLCTSCIVCSESIPLTQEEELSLQYGHSIHSKICDKCKQAILHMREQIE